MNKFYSNQNKVSLNFKGTSIQVSGKKADYLIYGAVFMFACVGLAYLNKSNLL